MNKSSLKRRNEIENDDLRGEKNEEKNKMEESV